MLQISRSQSRDARRTSTRWDCGRRFFYLSTPRTSHPLASSPKSGFGRMCRHRRASPTTISYLPVLARMTAAAGIDGEPQAQSHSGTRPQLPQNETTERLEIQTKAKKKCTAKILVWETPISRGISAIRGHYGAIATGRRPRPCASSLSKLIDDQQKSTPSFKTPHA